MPSRDERPCAECGKVESKHFGPYCYPAPGFAPVARTDFRVFSVLPAALPSPDAGGTTPPPIGTVVELGGRRFMRRESAYHPHQRWFRIGATGDLHYAGGEEWLNRIAELEAEVSRLRSPAASPPADSAARSAAAELHTIAIMLDVAGASGQEGDSVADRVQIMLDSAAHTRVALAALHARVERERESAVLAFAEHLSEFGSVVQREKLPSIARAFLSAPPSPHP